MAKKCIPGVICVENMTLFILVILSISVAYLYYREYRSNGVFDLRDRCEAHRYAPEISTANPRNLPAARPDFFPGHSANNPPPPPTNIIVHSSSEPQQNLYAPPLNTIDVRGPVDFIPTHPGAYVGVVPVNIRTSSANTPYRQIGILTKNVMSGRDPLILPLFGRNLLNGRDKWQYYTMANGSGVAFNAKLPISVNGKSCTSEYGCDSVSNGDTVYVEGYDDTFRATIYENGSMSYIPF